MKNLSSRQEIKPATDVEIKKTKQVGCKSLRIE